MSQKKLATPPLTALELYGAKTLRSSFGVASSRHTRLLHDVPSELDIATTVSG